MDRWIGKVAIITGASAGIGAQITRALAKNGMKVIAVARRLEKLEELAESIKHEFNTEVYTMQCDVRKEENIRKVFKWAEEKFGGTDVMINNAGVVSTETIIEGSTETYREIMDVNVIASAICSRELVQSVKKRRASGHIINISSIAGHNAQQITQPVSLYCASKFAITGMAASLCNKLINANIDVKVTNVSPGAVRTPMLTESYGLSDAISNGLLGVLEDKDVADAVVYILSTPPYVQIAEVILTIHEAAFTSENVKRSTTK
ncbi:PREDICTED: dehydrogenase/reductase SDR family member 11-like [Vollenhovia emeryi]|uniref:dehydrogenase/reductase SDR family member 11-like n=1 Tax=Vollenhovia emeryi TaxID=411798 RepID=UPI0005F3C1A9|nr:PREDICTED: dehydrogenase/reductase SDR family member 11-like [Vollenhovia emeryi]